tara:strand:- start:7030 stop:7287 length:258 start_codon:yes stop_codon:yes gene_type:complete
MPKLTYTLRTLNQPVLFKETGKVLEIPMKEDELEVVHKIEEWIKENCSEKAVIEFFESYDYMGNDKIVIDFKSKEDMLLFKLQFE